MWKIVSIFLITVALISGISDCPTCPQSGVSTHYFNLEVSPAEVWASIGEQIEISLRIHALIHTLVSISSVDMLLFDSCGHMTREQAMTQDSDWYFHTVYTIVGDEANFMLTVNYTFPHGQPGEHSELGAHCFPIVVKR